MKADAEASTKWLVPAGYAIRLRRVEDDPLLLVVENRAAELFRNHGYPDLADDPFDNMEDFRAMIGANRVWVAIAPEGLPVGYAVAGPLDDLVHLRELSVDPAHGRRGVGAALVRTVLAAAKHQAAGGVSLTTFRDVPFNRPFYKKLGFEELPSPTRHSRSAPHLKMSCRPASTRANGC
ncbi:GNAT family N-acetyltransferase [Nitratireductor mangrovi]|uniref:GNAT family N-acetyltransferase n=1 Tax=Nitratireductor mangrovi TaxID=2599600 RepID=A0A5B8L2I7_9HYPH|nr:GNAT family N-acetyltransferase [Nitratireductor mangrovi]QDZ02161.1 GNAT family N-acetyltransferase [Nitratireductor mangrovi]